MTQVPDTLSGAAAALTGLVALAVVAPIAGWQFIRHGTVMAHEGAHAVFGSLAGRKIGGIELNGDATGGTFVAPGGCLGSLFVSFAGYVGPSLFGLGGAWAIHLGYSESVLWVALFLLVVLAFMLRWSYGVITVVVVGAPVYLVGHYGPPGVQIVAAYFLTWLLLLSGVRRILEIGPAVQRRRGPQRAHHDPAPDLVAALAGRHPRRRRPRRQDARHAVLIAPAAFPPACRA